MCVHIYEKKKKNTTLTLLKMAFKMLEAKTWNLAGSFKKMVPVSWMYILQILIKNK